MEPIKWMQQPCQQQQGGAPCRILVSAIMQEFTAIPADKSQWPEFDRRLREVFKREGFNQSVHNETTYTPTVCKALQMKVWDPAARDLLWDVILDVCAAYP